jgi:4-diphosphocytidyl-2C-methyl-D-erythritol kinase
MKKALGLCLAVLLAACARPQQPVVEPAIALSPEQILEKINSQSDLETEVAFQAMPDDAVVDLRTQSENAERNGDIALAIRHIDAALQMQANDPESLQQRAELAIRERRWPMAEQLAQQSFAAGAKLGSLCRRNWLTVHYASLAQGRKMRDPELAKHIADCTLLPPARL